MAFFRFTRDKRGYQHYSLVESSTNRRGKVRQRVLYWFRSPPDIKVGREPFDEDARHALEAQYPDVTFDWRSILEAPIPSADAEKWRERRRVERAAKQAIASATADEEAVEPRDAEGTGDGEDSAPARADAAEPAPIAAAAAEGVRRKRRRRRGKRPATEARTTEAGEQPDGSAAEESPDSGESSGE